MQTGRFKQQRIHGGGDFLKRDSKNNDGSTDEHFDDQFKDDFFFDESNHEETPNETLDDFDDDSGMLVLTEGGILRDHPRFFDQVRHQPLMHLLEISIFSLNNDIVRLTKIMNNLV